MAGSRRWPDGNGDGGEGRHPRHRGLRPGPGLQQMSAPCRGAGGYLRRCRVHGGGRGAAGSGHHRVAPGRCRGAHCAALRGHAGQRGGRCRDAGHRQRRGCRPGNAKGRQLSARSARVGRRTRRGLRPRHAGQSRTPLWRGPVPAVAADRAPLRERRQARRNERAAATHDTSRRCPRKRRRTWRSAAPMPCSRATARRRGSACRS